MIPFPLGLPFYTYLSPGARIERASSARRAQSVLKKVLSLNLTSYLLQSHSLNDPMPIGTFFLYLSDFRSARRVHKCNLIVWDRIAFALHLGVFGAGLHPGGPGCPVKPWNGHHYHPEQPLLTKFFKKLSFWGSSCSWPTPWCHTLELDFSQMVLAGKKYLQIAFIMILNNS